MSIREYFKGKSVLITGGTGFMGKVLIEKLLRSCPDLDKIYLLLRQKRGKSKLDRVKDLMNVELFYKLDKKLLETKIVPVSGDVMELNLGLSPEDRKILIQEVSVFFHVAASVRFAEPLRNSILMNIRGTREVCNLVLEMAKIEVFQYVSTAYSNANRQIIHEILYKPHGDWRKFIEIAENVDYNMDLLTGKMLDDLPNTYVFTKSMAERVVSDLLSGKVPAIIIRPSIVISSAKEPMRGWVDNFNGPVSIMVGGGKGLLRTVYSNPKTRLDFIPVDDAIKGMIISVWKKALEKKKSKKFELSVYNASGSEDFSVNMGEMVKICNYLTINYPYDNQIWYGKMNTSLFSITYWFKLIFQHLSLCWLLDLIGSAIYKKKPVLVKILKQCYQGHSALQYYTHNEWFFINEQFLDLQNCLLKVEDLESFKYELGRIRVYEFFDYAAIGFKKYLLRDNMLEFEEHKKKSNRMKILRYFVNTCFYLFVFWCIYFVASSNLC